MALLDDALEASGGLTRWRHMVGFTVHASVSGAVFSGVGRSNLLKDVVVEGDLLTRSLQLTGLVNPNHYGLLQPDRVAISDSSGEVLQSWDHPHTTFLLDPKSGTAWNDLQIVYICGLSIWNFVTAPFMLAQPDMITEELPPQLANNQALRRLRAISNEFAPNREQLFYFDADGLTRRTDYNVYGSAVAHYTSAHQKYCDVVIPTLRRSRLLDSDGTLIDSPPVLDLEIFDAKFE